MSAGDLAAIRWLTSSDAVEWLELLAEDDQPLTSQIAKLRRSLSPERARLVVEQAELRRRAASKFSSAGRMFFTRRGLEQSTSEIVAAWKAQRFAARSGSKASEIVDLCCGIGGDLIALASCHKSVGVDRDETIVEFARANLAAMGLSSSTACCADVRSFEAPAGAMWHLDPDRRTDRGRTSQPEFAEPGLEFVDQLRASHPTGAVKLAPAARVPQSWALQCEREWISEQGECKQQVAWFGGLAARPGLRSATILSNGREARTVAGDCALRAPLASAIEDYLYEPDAAIFAADLVGVLAQQARLAALGSEHNYLTANRLVFDPALATFQVTDVLPFDRKKLKAILRARRIGRLEIKTRGVQENLERLRRELTAEGDAAATLLLARIGIHVSAVLAQRVRQTAVEDGA